MRPQAPASLAANLAGAVPIFSFATAKAWRQNNLFRRAGHYGNCSGQNVRVNYMPRHEVTRSLPYSVDDMYKLIADIERYPEFLPWCAGARIRKRVQQGHAEIVDADLIIAFKVFREKFTSRVTLLPKENRIETDYIDGPFKYLTNRWSIVDTAQGCDVTCFVDFEFKSLMLQTVIGVVFNEAMSRLVHAFEARAHELYGSAAANKPKA